ncbi:MAG TPA: cytidylate kinase family protein [Candidatus Methylomirabilis sp.]|nr:cytidylate kinase family protein [Candidatus Methylomirabilis sp.]
MAVLTISQELGSGGTAIVTRLAEVLGVRVADREIILKAAAACGIHETKLEEVADKAPTLWERIDEEKRRYSIYVREAVYDLAREGQVILVGRGGQVLFRDVPHVLKIRIVAPLEARARRVAERQKLDPEAALRIVERDDRDRAARMRYLFDVDWRDPRLYDLVLNTGHLSAESAVEVMVALARKPEFTMTRDSLAALADLFLASKVEAALASDPRTRGAVLSASCRQGRILVSGGVYSETSRQAVEEIARAVPGVSAVQADLYIEPIAWGLS